MDTNKKEKNYKEGKEGEGCQIPSLQEVVEYFKKNGYKKEAALKAFKFYNEPMVERNGRVWKDSKNNTIKNWKQKMIGVWFKTENKAPSGSNGSDITFASPII